MDTVFKYLKSHSTISVYRECVLDIKWKTMKNMTKETKLSDALALYLPISILENYELIFIDSCVVCVRTLCLVLHVHHALYSTCVLYSEHISELVRDRGLL